MTVSQYDHVVPYTDLGGRGYFGVNAAVVVIDDVDAETHWHCDGSPREPGQTSSWETGRWQVSFNVQNRRIKGPCQKVQDSSKNMQRFWWVQVLHALHIAC